MRTQFFMVFILKDPRNDIPECLTGRAHCRFHCLFIVKNWCNTLLWLSLKTKSGKVTFAIKVIFAWSWVLQVADISADYKGLWLNVAQYCTIKLSSTCTLRHILRHMCLLHLTVKLMICLFLQIRLFCVLKSDVQEK